MFANDFDEFNELGGGGVDAFSGARAEDVAENLEVIAASEVAHVIVVGNEFSVGGGEFSNLGEDP